MCIVVQHKLGCHSTASGIIYSLVHAKSNIILFYYIRQHRLAIWCWQGIFLQNMWQFVICTCKNTSTAISKIYTVLCCRLSCIWQWPHDKMVAGCIFYYIALYTLAQGPLAALPGRPYLPALGPYPLIIPGMPHKLSTRSSGSTGTHCT